MYSISDLYAEAREAEERVWFVQSIQSVDRTDHTISLRLNIRYNLFVHVFLGELTGSLYFALVERGQRIFGVDLESGDWHIHPYDRPRPDLRQAPPLREKTGKWVRPVLGQPRMHGKWSFRFLAAEREIRQASDWNNPIGTNCGCIIFTILTT
jgi:hypothetical protein